MHPNIKVGIIGATGYTGVELLRLLAQHPHVEVTAVTSRSEAGISLSDYFPSLRHFYNLEFKSPTDANLEKCDIVFFATPHGVAMRDAPALLEQGVRVIDLSADFRIQDIPTWEKWYNMPFTAQSTLSKAVYGLSELNRHAIKNAQLIANPGCYPTCVSLPLIPLLKANAINTAAPIIADCKSGISGAGRKASINHLYCEVADSMKAYGVNGHRHLPEIKQTISQICPDAAQNFVFVPHLIPMSRGMQATQYIQLIDNIDPYALLHDYYQDSSFVDILPTGTTPETRSVRGSNICRISIQKAPDSNTWIILSVIDNLVKGAAGQAIQNMNIMLNLPENTGLSSPPMQP